MITVTDLSFHFGGQLLFKDVNLKFTPGNCYGIIGANGAGKSTFLKLLCGELEPAKGSVEIPDTVRMSVLRQDHFAFDAYTVLDTVMMGNKKLYDVKVEKDAIYEKSEFSEEDGITILLCHHPEYYDRYIRAFSVDLTLAGHAHGGQWRLFGQGLFAPGQGLFPRYTSGLYEDRLLVSRGMANVPKWIPRINNRPELILLHFVPKK